MITPPLKSNLLVAKRMLAVAVPLGPHPPQLPASRARNTLTPPPIASNLRPLELQFPTGESLPIGWIDATITSISPQPPAVPSTPPQRYHRQQY